VRLGVEYMVAVTAPFYCQLCKCFYSSVSAAEMHLMSADHNEKSVVCIAEYVIHSLLTVVVRTDKCSDCCVSNTFQSSSSLMLAVC